jgi:hypothetical protein
MAKGTYSSPMWHREGLIDEEILLFNKLYKPAYRRFVDEVDTRDRYYQLATVSDMPAMSQVDELVPVPELNFETPYSTTVVPLSYKGKFKLAFEAYKRDPEGLYKNIPKLLSRAYMKSMDGDCAGFISRPDDAAFITTPDGIALASTAHLTAEGTFSNILSGNGPLTYAAAQALILAIMQHPDYNGDNMEMEGPFYLCVPPALAAIAQNIKNTINGGYRYDTADREPNWVGGMIADVIIVPKATSNTAWALVPVKENPLLLVKGLGVQTVYTEDGDDFSYNWSLMGMYALGARRPQGFGWSAGDGS